MINLLDSKIRADVVQDIESFENQKRKAKSQKELDVYRDKLTKYVSQFIDMLYGEDNQIPVVSSINICKRIVENEASLYKTAPKRTFIGLSDQQVELVNQVYRDMMLNVKMRKANIFYRLQNQTLVQVALKNGMLELRNYAQHQYDAIPGADPTSADAYIISGFDRGLWTEVSEGDNVNQAIADNQDYKATLKMRSWWSKDYNFITDQKGMILPGQTPDNVLQMMPFVDIASDKDYAYYVDSGSTVVDFTIEFNADLTDDNQIARMQGFGQAYWKGAADLIPEQIKVGPSYILKIPINPNNPTDSEFGFASANPDLAGLMSMREMKLAMFLTSRGLDPKVITGTKEGQKFNSGLERLLYLVEKFEASQSDISLFQKAEDDIFKIILQYLVIYGGSEGFKYPSIGPVSKEARVIVDYVKPEVIKTESEQTDLVIKKLEAGLISKVEAIMESRGVDKEQAEEILEELNEEFMLDEENQTDENETEDDGVNA